MRSAPNLSFEPRRSRLALVLTLLIGLLAAGAVYASGMPAGPKIGLAAFIAIALALALALAVRTLAATSLPRCTRQAEGRWSIAVAGSEQSATLERSHDLGFLIALHFRTDSGQRIDLALWPDSIPPDTRRQLRVWLGRTARY